jgi:hypothetical protein
VQRERTTMRSTIFTLGLLACSLTAANAQPPTQPSPGGMQPIGPVDPFGPSSNFNQNNFMPNIYNPQYQPLSPYLYGVRGTNPAVDYYFGTRPGTLGMGPRGSGGSPFMAMGGNRMMFFPQLANAPEPFQTGITSQGSVLPPAGHPVVFNNTMGYYPSAFGQAGGRRPGLAGIGGSGQSK